MNDNDMIMVESASDWTLVINLPELNLRREWNKRGAKYPISRRVLFQAYYNPSVEGLFKDGNLITDDKEFLRSVGLLDEKEEPVVLKVTDKLLNRMISVMPIIELKEDMKKMITDQLKELANYAVFHYNNLAMDRVELISKATGVDVLSSITNYKRSKED